jgi:PAS domain S-box-containing protein
VDEIVEMLALAARACGADAAGVWTRIGGAAELIAHTGLQGARLQSALADPALTGPARGALGACLHASLPSGAQGGVWLLSQGRAFAAEDERSLQAAARAIGAALDRSRAQSPRTVESQLDAWARFQAIFDGVSEAVFIKDAKGRYLAMNAAGAAMLDRTLDEIVGKRDAEIFDAPSATYVEAIDQEVLASGGPRTYESHLTSGGVPRVYITTKAAFRGRDGEVLGLAGISRDMTALRVAERDRGQLLRTLEAERARLLSVLHQIPSGVVITEEGTGRILLVNEQASRLFQLRDEETLQQVRMQGQSPEGRRYRRRDWPMARSLMQGQVVVDEDIEVFRPDGAHLVLRVSSAPLAAANGRIEAAVTVFNDVTERRRAAQDLREREERLRLAVEAAELGIWDCDLKTGAMRWNARQAELFGYPPGAEGTLESCLSRLHSEDRAQLEASLQRAHEHGEDLDLEMRVIPDGHEARWVSCSGRVIRDAQGKPARLIGVLRDITARKRVQEESARLAGFREQLLAIVGHDLRNPLTAILAGCGLMTRQGQLDEKQSYAVARITSSAQRMQRLINDLLDLTRARLGAPLPLAPRECDANEIAREVVEELSLSHPGRIRLEPEGEGRGQWDPERLAQVFSNLVGNALQHGREGAAITVRLVGSERSLTFTVHSEGEPIPPEIVSTVFEAYSGPKSGARGAGSMGLGLYIVRQIVVAHGGTVAVNSHPIEGTTFTVALPRNPPPGPAE